jgi:hypothetical protein
MVAVPPETPLTTPKPGETVATKVLSLVHVPPTGESLNVIDDPAQTIPAPDTGTGCGVMVKVVVVKQPPGTV